MVTTRRIVVLLPDREEASLVNWLQKRSKLEIITRDRYGKYRRAATKGAYDMGGVGRETCLFNFDLT